MLQDIELEVTEGELVIRPCPDHRAGDGLELFRRAHAQPAERTDELVRALGIGGALRKRVTRAPLLLLDEPLDGLDLHQVAARDLGALQQRVPGEATEPETAS